MIELRRIDRENLTTAYGVDSERLVPWAVLNAPFEGAWCVLGPGGVSTAHAHHEFELFIAMTGRGVIDVDGERRDFVAGDLVHLRPGTTHYVSNAGDTVFQWYAIWWDREMSSRFLDTAPEEIAAEEIAAEDSVS